MKLFKRKKQKKVLVMNGPNLNFLGVREPEIYGRETLEGINNYIKKHFRKDAVELQFFQSNWEGELIDKLQEAHFSDVDAIVYNPGAHTHYSYAIRDAIASISKPVIEVHLSDINSREAFRKTSVTRPVCEDQVSGLGKDSYVKAIEMVLDNHGDMFWTRDVKTKSEIRTLISAQEIADKAFLNTLDIIKSGMKEIEIKEILEANMKDLGAEDFSFETLVGAGKNAANIHAYAGDYEIKKGDSIVIDFGVKHKGYCSDTTRTVFVGKPKGRQLEAWEAVVDAHESAASKILPGMTGTEAHELAISRLETHGFSREDMPHGLGHGVGRDIHEKPVLSPRGKRKLQENNVITIEPGIYIKDEFGIRLEDCGVLRKTGFESFTKLTHDLIVI